MELTFRGTFRRDYKNIGNKDLFSALGRKISEVKSAEGIHQVQHLKKLRKYETRYRIELRLKQKRIYADLLLLFSSQAVAIGKRNKRLQCFFRESFLHGNLKSLKYKNTSSLAESLKIDILEPAMRKAGRQSKLLPITTHE